MRNAEAQRFALSTARGEGSRASKDRAFAREEDLCDIRNIELTRDFDKNGRGRNPRRYDSKRTPYEWQDVDDAEQADMITPVKSTYKSKAKAQKRREHDAQVDTMYVEPNDSFSRKNKVVERHAEDYASFRAEVEAGEVDPYAVPSYGVMADVSGIRAFADELMADSEKKEQRRRERKADADRKNDDYGASNSDCAERRESKPRTEKEQPVRQTAPKAREKQVKQAQVQEAVVTEKAPKRSFLAKIKEAVSTGKLSVERAETRTDYETRSNAQLTAGKLRWLTINAKKALSNLGYPYDAIDVSCDREQLCIVTDLLEALIKANLAAFGETAAKAKAPASEKKITVENVFDREEEPEKKVKLERRADRAEKVERGDKQNRFKDEEEPERGRQNRKDRQNERQDDDRFENANVRSRRRDDDYDRSYDRESLDDSGPDDDFDSKIAFWENMADAPEPSAERARGRDGKNDDYYDDDFDEWDGAESKKKSDRQRQETEAQSVCATPSNARVRSGKRGARSSESLEGNSNADRSTRRLDDRFGSSEERLEKASKSESKGKALETFGNLTLTKTTLRALQQMGYSEPTPIQAGTIPSIQTGVDVMGQAKTGTGKTAAFMIPIVEGVDQCERADGPLALIVAPTRELAVQICDEAKKIAKYRDLSIVACYGGTSILPQVEKLRKGADIVVGTPGRIIDLSNRGALTLTHARWVVLDEADRMLDIGFRPDVEKILRKTPSSRQTLLFSATLAPPVVRLAQQYMRDPEKFDFSQEDVSADTIEQFYLTVDQDRKFDALVRLIEEQKPRQAIVFCRTKRHVDMVGRRLTSEFADVEAIHGDLPQSKRDRIMRDFRAEKTRILVATDIVGRGIDVSSVSHIVNYDVPQYCDDYVHRVGRAGRMGREGVAYTLVTVEEGAELTRIEMRINRLLERVELTGFEAYSKPVADAEPPERKLVFGQTTHRFRHAL